MGTILENHTLHIINEDKTSEQLTGVMIQVNDAESVFHVRAAKNRSIPPVSNSAFKCVEPELQPVECEKWRGCFDCPYYRQNEP